MIAVPKKVCESLIGKVVGCEWGPDNHFKRSNGWLYLVNFYVADLWRSLSQKLPPNTIYPTSINFQATEDELISWQGG